MCAIDCLQDDSFNGSMDKDRHKGEYQNTSSAYLCRYTQCFSLIYIGFPAQQLAGRFSTRLHTSPKVSGEIHQTVLSYTHISNTVFALSSVAVVLGGISNLLQPSPLQS